MMMMSMMMKCSDGSHQVKQMYKTHTQQIKMCLSLPVSLALRTAQRKKSDRSPS